MKLPGVFITLKKWGHYPNNGVTDPFLKGQKETPGTSTRRPNPHLAARLLPGYAGGLSLPDALTPLGVELPSWVWLKMGLGGIGFSHWLNEWNN